MNIKLATGDLKSNGAGLRKGESLLASLMAMTKSPPPERLFPEVRRLVDGAIQFISTLKSHDDSYFLNSRLSVILYNLLTGAVHDELRDMAISGLCKSGTMGQLMVVDYFLGKLGTPDELNRCLGSLDVCHSLGVLDKLMLVAHRLEPGIKEAALKALWGLKDGPTEDDLEWIIDASGYEPGPSYALKEALADGVMGHRCVDSLAELKYAGELLACIRILNFLGISDWAEIVAPRLKSLSPQVLKAVYSGMSMADQPSPALVKALVKGLGSKDDSIRELALEGLFKLNPPNLVAICSKIFAKVPSIRSRLAAKLAHLDAEGFKSFYSSVDNTRDKAEIKHTLLKLLAEHDPQGLGKCLDAILANPRRKPLPEKELAYFKSMINLPVEKDIAPPKLPDKECISDQESSSGLFNGIFKSSARKKEPTDDSVWKKGDSSFAGKYVHDVEIVDNKFLRTGCDKCFVREVVFKNCVFNGCSMCGAVFFKAEFINCSFENVSLKDAVFHDCMFKDTVVAGSFLERARFEKTRAEVFCLERSSLAGAVFASVSFKAFRLFCCDLGHANLSWVDFRGACVELCLFEHSVMENISFDALHSFCNHFIGCRITGVKGISPQLTRLEWEGMTRAMAEKAADMELAVPPKGMDPAARKLEAELVMTWLEMNTLKKRLWSFLKENARREEWGMAKLGGKKAEFYKLAPFLMHSTGFDMATGLFPDAPPCRIEGYYPTYEAVQLAKKYFPDQKFELFQEDAVHIESLYTIGSVGTVAQNEASDIDYWVCANLSEISEYDVTGLNYKLEKMSEWADEMFGVEAYFFLMDTEDVRRNNFGFSGEESSGSAQALMLKEEFYRTALHVAGRYILWWFSSCDGSDRSYNIAKKYVPILFGDELAVDMGNVAEIPEGEFFGASLWQIVKGIKSPFKSIMKFGLLERYTLNDSGQKLLCNAVKQGVFRATGRLVDIDPYIVMFREIIDHYKSRKDKESVNLVTLSFFLKSKFGDVGKNVNLMATNEERGVRDLFSVLMSGQAKVIDTGKPDLGLGFKEIVALGSRVNRFMIKTYNNVRKRQDECKVEACISPEDLTKLGRKIFSNFMKRPNKVERMPYLATKKELFSELFLSSEEHKKGRMWKVQGGVWDEVSGRSKIQDLKSGPDLFPLLNWVVSNGLCPRTTAVKTDMSASPVTVQDIQRMMNALMKFFPAKATFSTPVDENLNPERVVRAFLSLNLTQPKDLEKLKEVHVTYSTNWGELFCCRLPAKSSCLKSPGKYLKTYLEQQIPDDVKIEIFIPDRSRCPRPVPQKRVEAPAEPEQA